MSRLKFGSYCGPLTLILVAAIAVGGCESSGEDETGGSGGTGAGNEGGAPPSPIADADGDGISDADEGTGDADSDGIPNSEDDDSDGDGLSDVDEAGDDDPETPPVDSDNDDIPDFLDDDSDNNGIVDQDEGTADFDNDGTLDAHDWDDDGDLIADDIEMAGAGADCDNDGEADAEGTPEAPFDCEGDGPDYQDIDSDGDTIADEEESTNDADADGVPDRFDADTDGDGFSDAIEAGDEDVATEAIDTDEDGIPNFRDDDSDSDGIKDEEESEIGTDPTDVDSDDDGVSDLVEQAAGTDPTDETDNPQANGDFVFIVPYQDPTTPEEDTVRFRTNIQFADVYFAFDWTGSMDIELESMRDVDTGVPAIVNDLVCDVIGGVCDLDADCATGICFNNTCIQDPNDADGCIPDLWTGVGRWDAINSYKNLLSMQPDPAATAAAVPGGTGGSGAEAPYQPSHCIANPALCPGISVANMACAATGIGCPGFRDGAIRIYVQITDADQQCTGGSCASFTAASAGAALLSEQIRFISLYGTDDAGGTGTPFSVAEAIGEASQTVDQNGDPFVYAATNAQVVQDTVDAVLALARGKSLNTTIAATDVASDAVDATQFIDYLEVNVSGMAECDIVSPTADTDAPGDGHDDAFPELFPGKHVCWDVHPVPVNTTVPATDEPQIYPATLTVSGDGSPLDERTIYFLIPPAGIIIEPPT